jgi:hypothetical protein
MRVIGIVDECGDDIVFARSIDGSINLLPALLQKGGGRVCEDINVILYRPIDRPDYGAHFTIFVFKRYAQGENLRLRSYLSERKRHPVPVMGRIVKPVLVSAEIAASRV